MSDDFETRYASRKELRAKANEINKAVLFDALASTSITTIHVEFDGEGDSGQIYGVVAFSGHESATLPNTTIAIRTVPWGTTEILTAQSTLDKAIENLCYDYLEQTHGGWENNDGGYGEFRIDVAKRSIELEFNGRFTDTWTDIHTF
jgi:hypothetical protein